MEDASPPPGAKLPLDPLPLTPGAEVPADPLALPEARLPLDPLTVPDVGLLDRAGLVELMDGDALALADAPAVPPQAARTSAKAGNQPAR